MTPVGGRSLRSPSGWWRCPWPEHESFAARRLRGLLRHVWGVHLHPPPEREPFVGPLDVRCPVVTCRSHNFSIGPEQDIPAIGGWAFAGAWPAVWYFVCRDCGTQWGQWTGTRPSKVVA